MISVRAWWPTPGSNPPPLKRILLVTRLAARWRMSLLGGIYHSEPGGCCSGLECRTWGYFGEYAHSLNIMLLLHLISVPMILVKVCESSGLPACFGYPMPLHFSRLLMVARAEECMLTSWPPTRKLMTIFFCQGAHVRYLPARHRQFFCVGHHKKFVLACGSTSS